MFNKNNNIVKEYKENYELDKGDIVEMEVDLRSRDKKERCLFFLIKNA